MLRRRAPSYLLVSEKKLKRGLTVAKFAFQKPPFEVMGLWRHWSKLFPLKTDEGWSQGTAGENALNNSEEGMTNKSLTFICSVTNQHFMAVKPKKTRTTKNGDVTLQFSQSPWADVICLPLAWATDDLISFPDL